MFVYYIIIGVNLEYGPNQENNNTLISIEKMRTLFCSTDKKGCCTEEYDIPGSWFLPNGSKISNDTQSIHIALGNQTVGLNITNIPELPSGIYHCEMMDRENITHHLYAGIYPEGEGMYADDYRVILAKWLACSS